MPFNADLAGAQWGPIRWEMTPRRVLAYRAALAPDDADGLDDAAAEGLFALPMQVVAPEWVLVLMAREHPGQTLTEAEGRRAVHAGQDSRFHRPIPAGSTLAVTATLVGARASRAGVVTAIRFETRDATTGELMVESLSTSVYRDVALAGAETAEVPAPAYAAPDAEAATAPTPVSPALPHIYSECAEIWNPIHTERTVALAAGLPDIIVHGTALWALAGIEAAKLYAGGDTRRMTRLAARFTGQAFPGQPMTLAHDQADGAVRLALRSEDGRALLTGVAEFSN
ncbi:MAG: MaoC/PaaZ C-terminal domain-containing protein [Caulobacter sp.]|nr:MaoC/PaaZ C-terminal domain-containing protein [Caulobacter sp.]